MAFFRCTTCDVTKTVPDKFLGRKVKCPGCKGEIEILPDDMQTDENDAPASVNGADGEALFVCSHCGYREPASAEAMGEVRSCARCSAKGKVVPLAAKAEVTADDVAVDDLADELAEDIGDDLAEDMEGVLGSPAMPAMPATLPTAIMDDEEKTVRLGQGGPLNNLFSGVITGLNTFFYCFALAVLLSPALATGGYFGLLFDSIVLSAIIGMFLGPLRSRVFYGVQGFDTASAAVLFLLLASVMRAMPEADYATMLPTIMACVAGMTLATGLLAWFTWAFKSGSWIRFMPVQILGGVVAGLGITVLCAAFLYMTGQPLTLDLLLHGLGAWSVDPSECWAWLPGVCFGVLLFVFFRKVRHPLWLALSVMVAVAGGAALALPGVLPAGTLPPGLELPLAQFTHQLDVNRFATLYSASFLEGIDWQVLMSVRVEMAAGVVLLLTMSLYKITRVESDLGQEIQLEKELQQLGGVNILAGIVFGAPVAFCLGRSKAHRRGGAQGPLATLIAALVLVILLAGAGYMFPYVPVFVPGGLLVFFGLNLIHTWLIKARHEFFRGDDYLLLVLTFAVTVSLGFVLGVGTGLALAMMVSVTRYGSGGVVKQMFSGANHRSHVDRAPAQEKHLKLHGDAIFVIRLQGFVTVGALHGVIQEVRKRMQATDRPQMESLIFDFSSVQRFGSAMNQGFARLNSLALDNEINMVLTNVPFEIENRLVDSGYVDDDREGGFKIFQNLDYALEWSEDQLLESAGLASVKELSLPQLLEPVYPVTEHIPYLMKLLQPIKIKADQHVFKQGDASDAMYFVQSGMFRIEINLEGGKRLRLKKMGPGAVFGEMGLYTDAPRSASVIASEPGTVYRLSKKRIQLIETKLPRLKSSIDRYLVNLMAGRIADANAMVRDLMR